MSTKIQDFMSNLRGRSDEVTARFSGVLRNSTAFGDSTVWLRVDGTRF